MGDQAIDLTEEETANLSEAELEALKEDDAGNEADDEKTGEDAALQSEDEKDADETDDEKTGEDAGEDAGEGETKEADKEGADEKTGDDAGDEKTSDGEGIEDAVAATSDAFVPKYASKLPEDFEEKKAAVNTRFDELETKYDDGDLSHKQYMSEFRKITDEKSSLDRMEDRAAIMDSQSSQNAEQHWQWQQDSFFREKENLELYKNNMAFDALNGEVKRLVAEEKTANLSGEQILKLADKNVRALLSPDGQEKKKTKKKEVARKPDLDKIPKTLSGLPSASGDSDVGGDKKFAYLDDLLGIEYENALAKLSDEDQAIYLKD